MEEEVKVPNEFTVTATCPQCGWMLEYIVFKSQWDEDGGLVNWLEKVTADHRLARPRCRVNSNDIGVKVKQYEA